MKQPKALFSILVLLLCAAAESIAATTIDIPYVCPIGGENFTNKERIAVYKEGVMLDMRPYGSYDGIPPLPVCPSNGFAMYQKKFTPDEVAKLTQYVAGPEYALMKDRETSYYLASKLMKYMGEKDAGVFYSLLIATWQARNADEYARYASEALDMLRSMMTKSDADKDPVWPSYQLLIGELQRRLGRFAEAEAQLDALKGDARFSDSLSKSIIALELELLSKKNTSSQKAPKVSK